MRFRRFGGLLLCLSAGTAWADAQKADAQQQATPQQSQPQEKQGAQQQREMRTIQLPNDSWIRYEVLPGDDLEPPGELIVMHVEPPPPAPQQARPASEEQPDSQERARAALRAWQRGRAACQETRAKLAARLLELRGVDVDPDVALWIERNLYFAGDGILALQVVADPLFFSALQSDSTARGLAVDLARCEQVARR